MKKKKVSLKRKVELCEICGQSMDLCVISHKNKPFIDNKNYSKICFTCYSVPKILYQNYDKNGYIIDEKPLDYSHENLHSPEELYREGSADSLSYAKKCVEAVKNLKVKKDKKIIKSKPKLEFYIL